MYLGPYAPMWRPGRTWSLRPSGSEAVDGRSLLCFPAWLRYAGDQQTGKLQILATSTSQMPRWHASGRERWAALNFLLVGKPY